MDKSVETQAVPESLEGGLLGPLPVVMKYLRKLKVRDIIDAAAPSDPRHKVTHGECIEALLCSIFLKNHTLSHVSQTLSAYDLPAIFGKPGVQAELFHDYRLGEALDALYGKTEALYAEVVFRGLEAFQIALKRLHLDSTTVSLHGQYVGAFDPLACLIKEPPRPDYGKSKDHRDDLKQLVMSLTVGDYGGPVYGRVTHGNTSDVEEFRHHLDSLAGMLGDLRDTLLVADCKLCTGPTLAQAFDLGFNLVTLVPETFKIRAALINQACRESLTFLKETETGEIYHGKSFKVPYTLEIPGQEDRQVFLRFLVIHSSDLERQRRETTRRAAEKESKRLEKEVLRRQAKVSYACLADAEQEANQIIGAAAAKHHQIGFQVEEFTEVKKRRGRQPAQESPVTVQRFRIHWTIQANPSTISVPGTFSPSGMYVLLTTISDRRSLSDLQVLNAYKGQEVVERGFHWLKGPLRVAPVFLKSCERIDVLGFVYLISMFVYALVQRDVRMRLKEQDATLPSPAGPRSDRPTAWGLFLLLEHLTILRFRSGPRTQIFARNFNKVQMEILDKCGWTALYFQPEKTT